LSSGAQPHLNFAPRPWRAPDLAGGKARLAVRPQDASSNDCPGDPAERALACAQAEAARLTEAARAEADSIRERAREQGLAEAQQAITTERECMVQQLTLSTEELQIEREGFLRQAEPEILKLSFAIAEKVIGREVSEHPDIVLDLIRKSMKRLKDKAELRIRVNPEDLQLVREARAELLASVDGVEKIEVSDDRRVGRGGCIIESPNGTLDARIATQLGELERSTAKVGSHGPDGGE
jgi:flagellar assembly protein FliH